MSSSLIATRRLAHRPARRVGGDGEPTGMLACLVMSLPMVWRWRRGHALDVERCRGSFCRASVVLPVLLASDRNEEWDGCVEAATYPMRGWRLGRHAGSFDVETAGLAA